MRALWLAFFAISTCAAGQQTPCEQRVTSMLEASTREMVDVRIDNRTFTYY